MICEHCGSENTKVSDTRQRSKVRRRVYDCFCCNKQTVTRESYESEWKELCFLKEHRRRFLEFARFLYPHSNI